MIVKSLKSFLICFSKAVLFFGIRTNLHIGTIFPYCIIWQLTSVMLSPDLLSPDTYHAIT